MLFKLILSKIGLRALLTLVLPFLLMPSDMIVEISFSREGFIAVITAIILLLEVLGLIVDNHVCLLCEYFWTFEALGHALQRSTNVPCPNVLLKFAISTELVTAVFTSEKLGIWSFMFYV